MNRPIDPETEITFLSPERIIGLQALEISTLEVKVDRLWLANEYLKSERQGYQAALVTLVLFFLVVALVCLVGVLG